MIMNIYKNSNNKAGTNKRPENWNLKMRGSKIMPGTSKYKNISTSEKKHEERISTHFANDNANDNLRNSPHF